MHLLTTSSVTLDDVVEPVDLGQEPGDIVILSFADSDLSALAAAWSAERETLPVVRLAHLRDLRHPMSVDLWIDRVAAHAKVIVVRLLGGPDWWRYGVDRLTAIARQSGVMLAFLPGEDRDDVEIADASTLPRSELDALLRYFREGGAMNMRALLRRLAGHAGCDVDVAEPQPVPRHAAYLPGEGTVPLHRLIAQIGPGQPVVPIIFYRAAVLAADTAAVDALCVALAARGLAPAPLMITSLKEAAAAAFARDALAQLTPSVVVTTTAFAVGSGDGDSTVFDGTDAPVLQAIIATTRHEAWRDSPRGLGAADLAMHVVLPELDGRVLAGAIAFKDAQAKNEALSFTGVASRPEPDRIDAVADRIAGLARLRATPRAERRVAILMPDYPGMAGRTGYAVGLDVPQSVVALLGDLAKEGYAISDAPLGAVDLLGRLEQRSAELSLPLADYRRLLAALPADSAARLGDVWGDAANDPDVGDGAFQFRAVRFGNVIVALPPDRGRPGSRRADYHDAELPPRHALVAFGLWLRHVVKVDALVHMGAHGTLEWLPGKAIALTASCFPELVVGALPVIYPFIVSNPGEAAQAKRRIAAVTLGHLPPPLVAAGLSGDAQRLEQLVDEYAQADGLDRRRRDRVGRLILDLAERTGLAREAGVMSDAGAEDALRQIDAWLCDIKDQSVKDGLRVYGRASPADGDAPDWRQSPQAERQALLDALDGKRVAAGPAGAPSRGRRDVLPTGRNLFTADPRMLPTPTAMDLGRLAADEIVRNHMQSHGEMPRALVMDLWGSATLRTGGEEIAQGLALLGCRPTWDAATGRVTGIEVLPTATMGRPRVDVTWRISGLFRDLFPVQLSLLDAAVQAVAARAETADENPLSAARGRGGRVARIFGTAPGVYGSGVEAMLGSDSNRAAVGKAYLASASHAYGGADGAGTASPEAFTERVAAADLLVHPGDDPGRDLLEGAEDAAFVGGFAAAAETLGRVPDLIMLDLTDPQRPRARPLDAALARIVRARAINPRFIAGQMRHGPRGAAELAETVDRLVAFAEMTGMVSSTLFDLVYDAYLGDSAVCNFLLRENPEAARAIAERLDAARRRGLWHPRRNDIGADLLPRENRMAS
ncbi:MAG: cobaltochelatase subunit CobN [Pseudolabrys sp.]